MTRPCLIALVALSLTPPVAATQPPAAAPLLQIQYLGVGGFWIKVGDREIMTAPLYSNPNPFKFLTGPIEPDVKRITKYHPPAAAPAAILVGHAHYDHLMDVPEIYQRTVVTRKARGLPPPHIFGSSTVARILAGYRPRPSEFPAPSIVIPPGQVVALDDRLDSRNCATAAWINDPSQCGLPAGRPGDWVPIDEPRVRIRALCSSHPPQVLKVVHLWPGCLHTDRGAPPASVDDYPEGPTFAYLIDFLDASGRPEYRIYYQDAPTNGSLGRIPVELLKDKSVDVALLAAGNWDAVFQPEGAIGEMQPSQVILGHWEDFFRAQGPPVMNAPTQFFGTYIRRIRDQLKAHKLKCDVHKAKMQEVFFINRFGDRVDEHGRIRERAR